jgi:hypothetical protein
LISSAFTLGAQHNRSSQLAEQLANPLASPRNRAGEIAMAMMQERALRTRRAARAASLLLLLLGTAAQAFPPATWKDSRSSTGNGAAGCPMTAKAKWGLANGAVRTADPGNAPGTFDNPKPWTPDAKSPPRKRKNINALTPDELALLKQAFTLMQNLPDDDPRSMIRQAGFHCQYCGGTAQTFNPKTKRWDIKVNDIHSTWNFLPFHRAFLHFTERIMRKLLQQHSPGAAAENFTLPYWDWTETVSDTDDGIPIPVAFRTAPLVGAIVEQHDASTPAQNRDNVGTKLAGGGQSVRRLDLDYARILAIDDPSVIFGWPPGFYAPPRNGGNGGIANSAAHATPHNQAGGWMWNLLSSPRTPLFFLHHGKVDRMWSDWAKLHPNKMPPLAAFKNFVFRFVDENGQWVKIRNEEIAKDLPGDMGYVYE